MTNANTTPDVSHAKTEDLAVAELTTSRLVRLDLIDIEDQVRTELDLDELAGLADSMEEHGQISAIVIRPHPEAEGRFILVAGERRYRAAQMLEWTVIEAKIRLADEVDAQRLQLIENIQREELSLADTAGGVANLYEELGNLQDVANVCGKSKPWVSKHLTAARKLNWKVARLLEEGRTEDLELLLLLNQLVEVDWFAIDELTREKMPTRVQVKAAIAEAKAEREKETKEAEERKKQRELELADPKAKEARDREQAEERARQKQQGEDNKIIDALEDNLTTSGVPVAELLEQLHIHDAAQLARIQDRITRDTSRAWKAGNAAGQDLIAYAAYFQGEWEADWDAAAWIAGTVRDATFQTLCENYRAIMRRADQYNEATAAERRAEMDEEDEEDEEDEGAED